MDDQCNNAETQEPDRETNLIATQNDQFRQATCHIPARSCPIKGRLVLTQGIDAEGAEFVREGF